MKISVFYDHILQAAEQTQMPLPALLKEVRKAGIEGLEINLDTFAKQPELPALIEEAGLKVSCIYAFYEIPNRDETTRMKLHLDVAKRMGTGRILVVPGFLETEAESFHAACSTSEGARAFLEKCDVSVRILKGLRAICRMAQEKGITVTVEDFDGYLSPLSRMNALVWFMEKAEDLRFTLDMGNFAFSNENVMEAYELLKNKIVHVHCKDRGEEEGCSKIAASACGTWNKGLKSVAVGEGYLPIRRMVQNLRTQGYDGWLAIEHFDRPDQRESILRSAAYLKYLTG